MGAAAGCVIVTVTAAGSLTGSLWQAPSPQESQALSGTADRRAAAAEAAGPISRLGPDSQAGSASKPRPSPARVFGHWNLKPWVYVISHLRGVISHCDYINPPICCVSLLYGNR